ncbi:hypothetical protein [Flagellimonas pacifica]|uniref:Uncharacterized protein n=1 Tax=Flagellimonas pacifica TaxID=1247520 RepID=A0A285MUA1_9FLAO|nr:hypothetical protein [Allomuricauda parva]SNZ00127.1 hypothetical protein SAMN06265377_1944 [Allomuricauda parva]
MSVRVFSCQIELLPSEVVYGGEAVEIKGKSIENKVYFSYKVYKKMNVSSSAVERFFLKLIVLLGLAFLQAQDDSST